MEDQVPNDTVQPLKLCCEPERIVSSIVRRPSGGVSWIELEQLFDSRDIINAEIKSRDLFGEPLDNEFVGLGGRFIGKHRAFIQFVCVYNKSRTEHKLVMRRLALPPLMKGTLANRPARRLCEGSSGKKTSPGARTGPSTTGP